MEFLIKAFSRFLFWFINFVFESINFFKIHQTVPPPEDKVLLLSASEAAAMIRAKKLTATKLISAYISRIKVVNPIINAVVQDNFVGALEEAAKIDDYLNRLDEASAEYKNLSNSKPLLGIPFTIKDTFAVKGFPLTAGIVARRNFISDSDAEVVKRMKEAGGILLAITNVPESARHVESNNQLFGRTLNPYDTRRTCGGSSGGEGALIGAAGSLLGIGSDLAGSIRIPAAFNGIFGLKPSEGAVSLEGHYPMFSKGYPRRMCYVGPICRYAKDLSLIFQVMTTGDEEGGGRIQKPISFPKIRFFYLDGLNSSMIEPLDPKVKKSIKKCIKYFEKRFNSSVHHVHFDRLQHVMGLYYASLSETKEGKFGHVIKQSKTDVNIFGEFMKKIFWKSDHTASSLVVLIQDELIEFEKENQEFLEKTRDKLRQEIISLLEDDAILIFPSWPTFPPFHNHLLLAFWNKMYAGIWNALRLPAIVCPLGINEDGLPMSIQLIAGPDNDYLLIAIAKDLEKRFGGWQTPKLR